MSDVSSTRSDEQPPHRGRWSRQTLVLAGLAAVLLIGLIVWWIDDRLESTTTDDAFVESDMVALAPRVEGQIVEMLVEDNQTITRGQPLARIDPVPYQRKLEQAQAALQVAQAEHAITLATLQRLEMQAAQQAVAPSRPATLAQQATLEVTEARRQADAAAQRIEAARADVAVQQLQLDYTTITAPFDGVLARRLKFRGDHGGPGVAAFSLYDPQNLFVTAQVEETRLTSIAPGQPVQVSVDAFAQPFKGQVLWVGRATGAQFALIPRDLSSGEFTKVVQRVPVRVALVRDERWPLLRPGLSASVVISHAAPAAKPD